MEPQVERKDQRKESPDKSPESPETHLERFTEEDLRFGASELVRFVSDAVSDGIAIHEVEAGLWRRVLEMGRKALGSFIQLSGDGDMGGQVCLPDGRCVRRLAKPHSRPYQSIFGAFKLSRVVYGTREGQKIELVPLDQRLKLPGGRFSYVLQEWDQRFAVESSYTEVNATVERILGFSQSVDSLERTNRKMAELTVGYWDSLAPPPASEEGELLVASADGKGVPMRRAASAPATLSHQPRSGPDPGAKKMALLGAAYTLDRYERTPEQVTDALFRSSEDAPPKRPRPQHKRVRASLQRDGKGRTQPATEEIFGWLSGELDQRSDCGKRPPLVLMDGQDSLWAAASSYLPDDATCILDLLHVTPRLWKAACLFHPKGTDAAAGFVRERVLRILRGEVTSVIKGLRRKASLDGLGGKKRKKLERICKFFKKNRERMRYGEYLAAGYPVATGVIEGACRHLVKDRLERAGMHWVLEGAQAMLDLRSIHIGEQWDEFTAYRIRREEERLYPHAGLPANDAGLPANDVEEWQMAA